MRATDAIFSTSWAILPEHLATILAIASREGTDAMLEAARARREARLQAVATQNGTPIDGTQAQIRNGVATLAITGPIVRYASLFADISGATSVESLAKDFAAVLNDPSVRGVVLNVDSPGGDVAGISEFSQQVYAARGVKPVIAYVGDLGASAAYWIAAAADEVVATRTALVGSIGVIAAVRDPSKTTAKEIEFVSSQSPKKRSDPTTETGKADIQAVVDALASVFVADVATYRGVSEDTVLSDFGRGGVLVGQAALDAGLIDRLGSYESVHAELAGTTPRDLAWIPGGGRHVPASRKPTPAAVEQEFSMANLKEMFKAMFSAMDETEIGVAQAESTTTVLQPAIGTTAVLSVDPAQAKELAELRAALATERNARVKDNAAAFADAEITGLRAMPAERETLIDAYIQAATDDNMFGASTAVTGASRVDALKARQAARPAHTLTTEALPVTDGTRAAVNRETTPRANAEQEATPEERARLLKLTSVGKQAIAATKN